MKKRADIQNYQRRFDRIVERLNEKKELSEHNSDIAIKFKNELLSQGISLSKTSRYLQDIFWLNKNLKGKNFDEVNRDDVKALVAEMNQSPLKESTKKGLKIMLRKLYRFIRGIEEKGKYPHEVDWFTVNIPNSNKLIPEELLEDEEMGKIIRACKCERDRALIASLCESGCRVGEIGSLQIKHISFEEYGARLTVRGKTGMRKILVINSTPFLQSWINSHPFGDDPEAYLWANPRGEFLSYARISDILKRAAKKAGISKKVYPHLLRHSRATILAKNLSDSTMKHYMGWTQSSRSASVYIHMSGKSTDEAILKANGIEIKEEKKESKIKPSKCFRCGTLNEFTNRFCKSCGFPLDKKEANEILKRESERNLADDIMSKLVEDKEIFELIKKKIN